MVAKTFETDWSYTEPQECRIEKHVETTVRCAVCKSPDVAGVCHHCGQYLCKQHIATPQIYQSHSQEFAPMLGGTKWTEAVHCQDHAHFVFSALKTMVVPGGIVAAISFLYAARGILAIIRFVADLLTNGLHRSIWTTWLVSTWMTGERGLIWEMLLSSLGPLVVSMIVLVFSAALFAWGLYLHIARYLPQAKKVPLDAVPIVPSQYVIQANETIEAEINVSKTFEEYIRLARHRGIVTISVSLDQDAQDSLEESRKKAERYGWEQPNLLDLGYIVLDRVRHVHVKPTETWSSANHLYRLVYGRNDVDVAEQVEKGNWQQVLQCEYGIDDQALSIRKNAHLPGRFVVWLKPTLMPMSAGRTVAFEFDLPAETKVRATLREFVLAIPRDPFMIDSVEFPVYNTNGQMYPDTSEIRWVNRKISRETDRWPQVTFTHDATGMKLQMTASFEIELDGTLSGLQIQRDHIWSPTGRPALQRDATATMQYRTLISGHAEIDPSVFSYQCERTESRTIQAPGVTLTPERVKTVLQALADAGVSLKNVSQHEPVVEQQEGAVVKRSWDILGRYYERIYPIDVHVVLSGREPHNKQEQLGSETTIQLAVRALVNSKAETMQQAIGGHCQRLEGILEKAMT